MNKCSRPFYIACFATVVGVLACCLLGPMVGTLSTVYDMAPAWSPNGQAIAFVCYRPAFEIKTDPAELIEPKRYYGDIPYKPQDSEICTMAPDGTGRMQLTHNRAADYDPVWSPDGAQIAFVSDREGGSDLYVMNMDGSQQRRVAHVGAAAHQAWSADSKRIAFLEATDYDYVLTVLDMTIGRERQLVKGQVHFPIWSPDSKTIAFIAGYLHQDKCEVHIITADAGDEGTLPITSACQRPAWSPDGTHLAFVGPQAELGKNVLYVLNLQTLETLALTKGGEAIGDGLVWSPKGDRVFYPTRGEIFAAKADGSGWNQITSLDGLLMSFFGEQNLTLSPDGRQIAFMRGEGARAPADLVRIWRINSDGSGLIRLSPLGNRAK